MWIYILRRLLYNIPVYLGILLFLMAALRINDPVSGYLGKNATEEAYQAKKEEMGLDRPFVVQYVGFVGKLITLDFSEQSWTQEGRSVGEVVRESIVPSISITVPALVLTSLISIVIAMTSAYYRGRLPDKLMMVSAVLGMSISFLVYIIFGQYWGAYWINEQIEGEIFAIAGYEKGIGQWAHFCLLPVLISTIVAMGYDTRFYRAVMVEESSRDYITTARAKGAPKSKIMFVHMLKNALIPIITRIMITLPFLVMGSLLLEVYFSIPGMGRELFDSIMTNDFPVTQTLVAIFAFIFILTVILTDVLYALVDPRVRLS
ncbi:MAG: ABC transporter permease [Planctomycetota bacterium]|nr:ABC transporter permease [Planctomycetota bacterium]